MRFIDLSATITPSRPDALSFERVEINYSSHAEGASLIETMLKVPQHLLRNDEGWAVEEFTKLATHSVTHVDAPWHYNSVIQGRRAATIDELPLEWFFSDGVVLDLRHKQPREFIEIDDLERALAAIEYELRPLDIVLLQTGCDRKLHSAEYFEQPGMGRESTLWLVEQGIKVIGIDAFGFDRPFAAMAEDFRRTGDGSYIWPAHFAGITRSYCQIEKLANLDAIGRSHGFTVAAFPTKIRAASAGFARVVALVPE
jgi:kynurenine formamidase